MLSRWRRNRFSASSRRGDLKKSITKIASECRIANIVRDHAMILADDATPKPDRIFGKDRQNLVVTYGAVDDARGLPAVAAELTRSQPELIVVSGTEAMLQSVLAANRAIAIVLIAVNFDPIARGYVNSLARPGGNITGVVFQQLELAEKQVELLTQTFPGKTRLAALYDAQTADQFSAAERSAKSLKLQIQGRKLENPPYDFDT